MEAEMVSDYDDIVTQDDIDFLHNHAEAKFGKPKFVLSSSDWGFGARKKTVTDIDTLHLRSHAEGVCRDHDSHSALYEYTLDILCLMALTEALGLEYG